METKTDRLDSVISDVAYILDCLNSFREMVKTGNCNTCSKKYTCKYAPKFGQLVRYNCPYYKEEKKNND